MSELNPLNKKQDKEDKKDPLQKMIEDNPCGICKAQGMPVCKGHGGSKGGKKGGVSSGGGVREESPQFELTPMDSTHYELQKEELIADEELQIQSMRPKPPRIHARFDLERIIELFLINNDASRGVLSLRLRPGLLFIDEKEIQAIVQAIKGAFDEFKMALENRGVLVDNFTTYSDKNTLQIRIPSPRYYDAFIRELIAKNLLANPANTLSKEITTSPNPFAMTPSYSKKDEEEIKRSAMSPFSTQLKLTPNFD